MKALATRQFWQDAFERALRTLIQTALALSGVSAMTPDSVASVSWAAVASGAVIAAVLSILTSIGAALKADTITPASFVTTTQEGIPQ